MVMSEKMPPGLYALGDPCYVFSEWNEWCEAWFKKTQVSDRGGVFEVKGHKVCAFYTKYGDGSYPSSAGHMLDVDSGSIGLVPIALVDKGDEGYLNEVLYEKEFEVNEDDGYMEFGLVSVDTRDEDECEDYCCHCGR
jgi:hypothetical protein